VESWCIDPNSILKLITPRTKAVIPVHLYGHPASMDTIMKIARDHNIYVVEDAAPAVGAKWNGKKVGTFGDFACFSFQGAKLLVTGEGGMLVTNNAAHYEKAKKIWDQGRDPSRTFWIDSHGLKYKMSNVQAALGLGQIQRCESQINTKRRIADWYREDLANCPHISLMTETPSAMSIYWMTSCLVSESSPLSREAICSSLKEFKIDTRPVFPAISQYPIWNNRQQPNSVAYSVGNRGINLPSGVCLSRLDIKFVCDKLRQIMSCT
jgi:perosamine synthetase